ncbi:hypothetical protein KKG90_06300 [Candidatus Bipolaricaulota bacterium]|nr:hypothetical protein [Candidatus Bipolaricaulota bacterium]
MQFGVLAKVDEYTQIVREHESAIAACIDSTTLQVRRQAKLLEIDRALKTYSAYQRLTTNGV